MNGSEKAKYCRIYADLKAIQNTSKVGETYALIVWTQYKWIIYTRNTSQELPSVNVLLEEESNTSHETHET